MKLVVSERYDEPTRRGGMTVLEKQNIAANWIYGLRLVLIRRIEIYHASTGLNDLWEGSIVPTRMEASYWG